MIKYWSKCVWYQFEGSMTLKLAYNLLFFVKANLRHFVSTYPANGALDVMTYRSLISAPLETCVPLRMIATNQGNS
jgi:hypothetical protein